MNEEIMKKTGFGKEVELVKEGRCPFCGKDIYANEFRDEQSKKEYKRRNHSNSHGPTAKKKHTT